MTTRADLEATLARAPGGSPVGDFSARERTVVGAILARRFAGFQIAAGRSKAQAMGDLIEYLLAKQIGARGR